MESINLINMSDILINGNIFDNGTILHNISKLDNSEFIDCYHEIAFTLAGYLNIPFWLYSIIISIIWVFVAFFLIGFDVGFRAGHVKTHCVTCCGCEEREKTEHLKIQAYERFLEDLQEIENNRRTRAVPGKEGCPRIA